ncbi:MAG: hypothetical protein ABIH82_04235 [Candidatus Woesearchaeota archaeon]
MVTSIDGVEFRDGCGEVWGNQTAISAAYMASPSAFLYAAAYGDAYQLVARNRDADGQWRDSPIGGANGDAFQVGRSAELFARQCNLTLLEVAVDALPK